MGYYEKFVAELQREIEELSKKLTEADWEKANADFKQLQVYIKELQDYANSNYEKFKSASKKTLIETKKDLEIVASKLCGNWELGLDFIRITTVKTLDEVNGWVINYNVVLKGYDLFLTATVIDNNVLISPATKIEWHNDEDYSVYSNLKHYRLLAILKQ